MCKNGKLRCKVTEESKSPKVCHDEFGLILKFDFYFDDTLNFIGKF